jgi:hypothetical protein
VKPDPVERLGARLFELARSEAAPLGAEQRALEAARREIGAKSPVNARFSARGKWLTATACVAIAAAAALLLRPQEDSVGISAEPSTVARAQPKQQSAAREAAPSEVVPAEPSVQVAPKLKTSAEPSPLSASAPSRASAPTPSTPASLSDELSALKGASNALSTGDPQAALAALDRYDRVLKGQKLRAEATLLKIEALARAGQAEASSELAQRFVEQNPGSPLVDRARSFVHE